MDEGVPSPFQEDAMAQVNNVQDANPVQQAQQIQQAQAAQQTMQAQKALQNQQLQESTQPVHDPADAAPSANPMVGTNINTSA
jgi:hypothetical protein